MNVYHFLSVTTIEMNIWTYWKAQVLNRFNMKIIIFKLNDG